MNFATKTLFSQAGGFLAVYLDSLIQGSPTGGFAAFLTGHPYVVPIYVAAVGLVHNYITAKYPTQAGTTQSPPPVPATPKP